MPFIFRIIMNLNPGSRNPYIYSFYFCLHSLSIDSYSFSLKLYLKINQMTCSQSPSLVKAQFICQISCEREKWEFGRESHLLVIHSKFSYSCCFFSFLALIHIYPHSILHLQSLEMNVGPNNRLTSGEARRQISDCHSAHKLELTKGGNLSKYVWKYEKKYGSFMLEWLKDSQTTSINLKKVRLRIAW